MNNFNGKIGGTLTMYKGITGKGYGTSEVSVCWQNWSGTFI